MKTTGPAVQHEVRYERETKETAFKGWSERQPTPNARASCSCGQLDTGMVDAGKAYRAAQEHVKRELPGVDWGPDIDGPERPVGSEETSG
ncbi:hypothetical protein ACKI10_17380 [Streptomyces galilaeus]|uniref:Uncharacterized protein n=1 Tax=Streptomyces galilaeus TaxID=33899 RepID=A0ABW9IP44_STRGJ